LINEILDLAQIESGRLSLSLEASSLTEIMDECRAMVESQSRLREIRLTFSRLEQPLHVNADRTRVKQILINLLSNAIKYNRIGGSIVVECLQPTPKRVRICVTDTGAGLSQDQLSRLFQPFNRLGQEIAGEQGTGIGLVVCKRLVESMGGSIGVESAVGKGSVFWIELALTSGLALPDLNHPETAQASAAQATVTKTRTLLYVEDNPANLMLVEDLIGRRPDIRLLSARDGNEGLEMARLYKPNLILMDINLPGISGITVLRTLSEDPVTARIPVVALSANAMPRDIEKGLKAGFYRYLTKPIKVKDFMDTLDLALCAAESQAGQPHTGSLS
jgi:CheY-like chemotaxis protein/anti-sigma regulatory factor (Ser/Thr protein kinase)